MTIGVPTFGVIARALGNVTPVAPSFSAGDTVIAFTGEHFGSDTLSGAPSAPWVERSANTNAIGVRAFALYSTTGAEAMPTFNWGASNRGWAVCAVVQGVDATLATGFSPGDRGVNSTSTIFGPASTKTPTVNGCISFLFGAKNKTSTSDATVFTPSSGFTLGFSDVPAGSANPAVAISYQIQTAATAIAANQTLTGSVADGTTQTSQGCIFSLQPSTTTPLAGTPSASTSASGTLTNSSISGNAAASANAAAGLTTAIRAAAAATAGATAAAALTNWTTVTLASTQYTGPGGLHDPALIAQGWDPPVGTTISYDATNATCYPNAEISSITNNCSFVAQYNDGTTWRVAIIVITPQIVSYATIAAAVAGALTTAIQIATGAIVVATSTGQLTSAILLSGSAAAIANAAAALSTGVQLGAAGSIGAVATGSLSGGQASLQVTATTLATALGTLTAKIQFAGAVVAASVVAGAIVTRIQLSGSAAALTNAAADIQVAIRLAGDATVATTAAGSALITSSLSAAANAVSTATGALFTAFQLSGLAFVSSDAAGSLSTGISLSGAAEADTQASIRPVGAEGQFGRADINILSPTGYPTALAVFIEGSSAITTISYFNSKGLPFVPLRVQWRVLDLNSGIEIIPYVDIADVEVSNAVTIPGDQNMIINQARNSEQHEILFKITDALGGVNYSRALFELLSPSGLN